MKYDIHIDRSQERNLSVRSDRVRWLTDAHIEHGVWRGRYLHGIAMRHGFSWLFSAIAALCSDVFGIIALWRDRARGRRHLARMDYYLLRDIGLSRLDAKREINKPFWRE